MTNKRTIWSLAFAFVLIAVGTVSQADEPSQLVATVIMQDEPRRLPADNTAMFASAAKEVTIQLDLLAEIDQESLAGTLVTVVDEQGGKRDLRADESGKVTIDNATAGPHAIVAANEKSHGTILLNFKEAAEDSDDAIAATQMPILAISANELLPVVDRYLVSESAPTADVVIDAEMIGSTAPSVGYQVRLGDGGVLNGQVISIVGGNTPGLRVEGTRIIIYKSGTPVAATTCDSRGRFQFKGIRTGVHGLIAAGPAGYAAFAFTALAGNDFAKTNRFNETFVSVLADDDILPVVLIPPNMVPAVIDTVREFYTPLLRDAGVASAGFGGPMAGSGGFAPTFGAATGAVTGATGAGVSSGVGGAGGGATGGIGGLGGLAALGVAVPVAIAVAADDSAPGIIASNSGL